MARKSKPPANGSPVKGELVIGTTTREVRSLEPTDPGTALTIQPRQAGLVPELGTRKKVSVFLTDLMAKTRQGGEAAAALIPWFCDALPSKLSREDYGRDLKLFVTHMAEQGIHPLDVTGDDVRLFKEAMVQAKMKASTIGRRLSVLRGVYEQLGKKGLVAWDTVSDIQAVKSPKVTKNTTPALSAKEASSLLHAPDTETLIGLRDHAMLFAYFKTAARCSAIANAKVGDLERTDTDWYLVVTEKGKKQQRKPLLEGARAVLEWLDAAGIRDEPDAPLFPAIEKDRKTVSRRHLSRRTVLYTVKKYGCQVGLEVDRLNRRGIGVHSLRKSSAENALTNGAAIEQVQAWLGHADVRTTQLYRVPKESDAEEAARRCQIR